MKKILAVFEVIGSILWEIAKYLLRQLGRYALVLGGIMLFMLAIKGCVFGV